SKKVQELQLTHDVLQADSNGIHFTQKEIDESFNRLKIKMQFSKTIQKADTRKPFSTVFIQRLLPVATAALVFAIIIPFRFTKSSVPVADIPLLTQKKPSIQASFVQKKGIVSDENIGHYTIDISATQLDAIDFFRPELTSDSQMKISITLTGMGSLPVFENNIKTLFSKFDQPLDDDCIIPIQYTSDIYK
ncbi:MAG TPA: hypothetical protein VFC68_03055, partial [Treponemataceae bacterium]|nr:hypothetical protein [Treponemataceae bacterium]